MSWFWPQRRWAGGRVNGEAGWAGSAPVGAPPPCGADRVPARYGCPQQCHGDGHSSERRPAPAGAAVAVLAEGGARGEAGWAGGGAPGAPWVRPLGRWELLADPGALEEAAAAALLTAAATSRGLMAVQLDLALPGARPTQSPTQLPTQRTSQRLCDAAAHAACCLAALRVWEPCYTDCSVGAPA